MTGYGYDAAGQIGTAIRVVAAAALACAAAGFAAGFATGFVARRR